MRKKCKRKTWALVNPIIHAIEGATMVPEDIQDRTRMRELAAIDAFARGLANIYDFQQMIDMNNLTEQLALDGVGPEALPAVQEHEAALVAIARRRESTGEYTATEQEIAAFKDVQQYHDLQRQSIHRSQYEQAFDKVKRRIKSRAPGVIEL